MEEDEDTESLDQHTVLEALKIADRFERVVSDLKNLGKNNNCIKAPSMDALEALPLGTKFYKPESFPFSAGPQVTPIGLDLDCARDEVQFCAIRLDNLIQKWMSGDE